MSYRTNFLLYNKCKHILLQESKRYAGHSKWQNIKHTKQENDAAKSTLFRMLLRKMQVVVQETGIADPSNNVKLSQLVDQAKKNNMPIATLNATLNRLQNSKENAKREMYIVRCPGGATLILQAATENPVFTRGEINTKLKKHNCKFADPTSLRMFDCVCYITATKDCNVDEAMEDAIAINAHDMEEVKEDNQPFFIFKCEYGNSAKYVSQLKSMGYSLVDVEDMCIPTTGVELSESDLNNVNELKKKLFTISAIEKIEDNILEP